MFEIFGKRAQGKTCPAIEGILEEGTDILDEFKDTAALDAGLVSAAQAVEHYEIARYGTLKRWAETLGMADAARLLGQTLDEESKTDKALTGLANSFANDKGESRLTHDQAAPAEGRRGLRATSLTVSGDNHGPRNFTLASRDSDPDHHPHPPLLALGDNDANARFRRCNLRA